MATAATVVDGSSSGGSGGIVVGEQERPGLDDVLGDRAPPLDERVPSARRAGRQPCVAAHGVISGGA